MELLAVVALVVILLSQLFIAYLVVCIEKWLSILSSIEPEKPQEEAKVTDPFTKPREIYSSTSSIVVPKTPQEIRNQNFEKIKEGIEYGDIAKG